MTCNKSSSPSVPALHHGVLRLSHIRVRSNHRVIFLLELSVKSTGCLSYLQGRRKEEKNVRQTDAQKEAIKLT